MTRRWRRAATEAGLGFHTEVGTSEEHSGWDATAAVQASQFTCQVENFGLVTAHGGALSAWRAVGRDLGATFNADVVHWLGHRPAAATVDVLVPAARHEDGTESFDAARTLARLG